MNPISSFRMGSNLSKLTDIFELVAKSKQISFIGAGGIDSFPPEKQREIENNLEALLVKLKKYPPYEITKALMGNLKIILKTGNELRANALEDLFEALVAEKVALGLDEFENAYGIIR